eukprot:1939536-Amphidinium_carterae.1
MLTHRCCISVTLPVSGSAWMNSSAGSSSSQNSTTRTSLCASAPPPTSGHIQVASGILGM